MSILDAIERVEHQQLRRFVAPIPTVGKRTRVFSLQDDIPRWFTVDNSQAGWWTIDPILGGALDGAVILHRALEKHRLEYLQQLPSFNVLPIFPVDDKAKTWLVTPYNLADAGQRGWNEYEPRLMYLADGAILPLQTVTVRQMGSTLLFDRVSTIHGAEWLGRSYRAGVERGDTLDYDKCPHKSYALAVRILADRMVEIRRKRLEREQAEKLQSFEGRMQFHLEFMGAKLEEWNEGLTGYNVRWSIDGEEYRMTIDDKMHINAAGICLAGTDLEHNLSTIVDVMQQFASNTPRRNTGWDNDEDD